jgi:hypothetical protein
LEKVRVACSDANKVINNGGHGRQYLGIAEVESLGVTLDRWRIKGIAYSCGASLVTFTDGIDNDSVYQSKDDFTLGQGVNSPHPNDQTNRLDGD